MGAISDKVTGNGTSKSFIIEDNTGAQVIVTGPFTTGTKAEVQLYRGGTEAVTPKPSYEFTDNFMMTTDAKEGTYVHVKITGAGSEDVHAISLS